MLCTEIGQRRYDFAASFRFPRKSVLSQMVMGQSVEDSWTSRLRDMVLGSVSVSLVAVVPRRPTTMSLIR